jgi:hypothetical protein
MNLQEQINRIQSMMGIVNETYNPDDVKSKYVDEKNIVNNEQFDKLKMLFPEYQQFIWVLKKLESNCFTFNEVQELTQYFDVFNKKKKQFPIKDLGQIKSCEQVSDFINKAKELSVELVKDKTNFIKSSDIKKLEDLYVKYMGIHDGFQVFVIPSLDTMEMLNINPQVVYSAYRNILSDCENRTESNKINFCTASGMKYFTFYIEFAELFVFHKSGDPNSPYQIGSYHTRTENFDSEDLYECKNKNNVSDDKVCPKLFDIHNKLSNEYISIVSRDFNRIKNQTDKNYDDSLKKSFWNRFKRKPETKIPSILQHKR